MVGVYRNLSCVYSPQSPSEKNKDKEDSKDIETK